jgi:hypothetical protein
LKESPSNLPPSGTAAALDVLGAARDVYERADKVHTRLVMTAGRQAARDKQSAFSFGGQ